ncbi:hypothetical protein E4U17_003258 [Claviceps sp. LM77 group G4]|nr:hypothetical protein E4U17_003258 [Claviceps sp. LM77 group G4]
MTLARSTTIRTVTLRNSVAYCDETRGEDRAPVAEKTSSSLAAFKERQIYAIKRKQTTKTR